MQAPRDENRATALLGVSEVDNLTPVAVGADPLTRELLTKPNNSQTYTTTYANDGHLDAFGRLRVSSIQTLFDTQLQYDAAPLFITGTVSGAATRTHVPNESCVDVTCTTASGDKIVSQTKEYFRYVPGKSMMIIMSRVLGPVKTNLVARTGLFDAQNGVFFETNGTDFGVVQRSFSSGSVVDTRVSQSNFNVDKLDGTGPSGININLSKANIYIIDIEWLGVGRVRFGIYGPDGIPHYCHYFQNANANPTVYMTTPNLPSRIELENTGTTASPSTMKVICTSVVIEDGGEIATGIQNSVNNGITAIPVTTRRAVLSIRPKATFNSIVNRSKISEFTFELLADADCLWEIVYNGSLGGTPVFASVGASSTVEYDRAGTTVTGGLILASGYTGVGFKGTTNNTKSLTSKLPFCLDMAGDNPTNMSLVVTSVSGTCNSKGAISWKEIY